MNLFKYGKNYYNIDNIVNITVREVIGNELERNEWDRKAQDIIRDIRNRQDFYISEINDILSSKTSIIYDAEEYVYNKIVNNKIGDKPNVKYKNQYECKFINGDTITLYDEEFKIFEKYIINGTVCNQIN